VVNDNLLMALMNDILVNRIICNMKNPE